MRKRMIILDTSAILYRAFYGNSDLKTSSGIPTGGVYGFINYIINIVNEFKPDYMVGAVDISRKTLRRTQRYSEYKNNRKSPPPALTSQKKLMVDFLKLNNIRTIGVEGYEADDIIGSVCKKFENIVDCIIITGDKDLSQLVTESTSLALIGKGRDGGFKLIKTEDDVIKTYGVKPSSIPDYFGLIGDVSDNIPGVKGIGEVTAVKLLERYGNLDNIYGYIDQVREEFGDNITSILKNNKDSAFLSKELATIDYVDIPYDLNSLIYNEDKRSDQLLSFLQELEFKSLIKKLGLVKTHKINNMFGNLTSSYDFLSNEDIVTIIDSSNESTLTDILKLSTYENNIMCFLYLTQKGLAISFRKNNIFIDNSVLYLNTNEDLKNFLLSDSIKVVGFDLKKISSLYRIKNKVMDISLAYHLITSNSRIKYENVVDYFLGNDSIKYEILTLEEKFGYCYDTIEIDSYARFTLDRVLCIKHISNKVENMLKAQNLYEVLIEEEIPLIDVLVTMEQTGIQIDKEYFNKLQTKFRNKLNILEKKIYDIAGCMFNIASTKQLGDLLYNKMKCPVFKKTKTGPSTDVEAMTLLFNNGYDIAGLILEHRQVSKLLTTYVIPLPLMTSVSSRLHTTFNQMATATGRLSSSEPNLQNIPARREEGLLIRQGFVASKGNSLIGLDYSQIELRVLAEMSEDETLINTFKRGIDLHDQTARSLFDIPEGKPISKYQRDSAKTINFSILYGKTAFSLSQELKITKQQAELYIERYFTRYPKVKQFIDDTIKFAETHEYVSTLFNRKRIIRDINSNNKRLKSQAERMAVNSRVQGTAAEIIKRVMIKIYNDIILKDHDIGMLLQIHDELIFEVPDDKVNVIRSKIEDLMMNTVKMNNVVLKVNSSVGKNLAETK